MARYQRGLTNWRGGRGRSSLVSYETRHDTNKDSPTRGEEEQLGELRSMARHKRGLTHWRGGRGRSGLVNSKAWHVTNEDSLAGGEEEGGAGLGASKHGTSHTRTPSLEGRNRDGPDGQSRNFAHHSLLLTQCRARPGA